MRLLLTICVLSFLFVLPVSAQVTLYINNESGQPDSDIWLQWTGQGDTASLPLGLSGTSGAITIAPSDQGTSNLAGFQLSSLEGGAGLYQIDNYEMNGGRLWFSEGSSGFTIPSTNTGYTPALADFQDPNFTVRYDKVEASITGSTDDNIDMTAVDGFSIPFQITAYTTPTPTGTPSQTLIGSPTDQIVSALSSVTQNSPYLNINSNSLGSAANGNTPVGTTGNFVRIIANDQTVTPLGNDQTVLNNGGTIPTQYQYQNYSNYLAKMDGTGTAPYTGTTTIKGLFSGLGAAATNNSQQQQNYNLSATFSATEQITMTSPTGALTTYTGVMTLTGSTTLLSGPNAGQTTQIIVKTPYAQLLAPSGIVGANPGYEYSTDGGVTWTSTGTAGPQNNVFSWVNGDVLAGMNVGTVGSTKLFSGTLNGTVYNNVEVGQIASGDWWYLGQAQARPGESVYDYYYGALQSSSDYYNAYAAALYPLTDAYGYAYGDRLQGGSVAISWNATQPDPVQALEITILPDTTGSLVGATAPEPGTWALLGIGLLILGGRTVWIRSRRRQSESRSANLSRIIP